MFLASIAFGYGNTHPLAPRYDISFELFQVMEATNTDRDTAQRYTQRVQVQQWIQSFSFFFVVFKVWISLETSQRQTSPRRYKEETHGRPDI